MDEIHEELGYSSKHSTQNEKHKCIEQLRKVKGGDAKENNWKIFSLAGWLFKNPGIKKILFYNIKLINMKRFLLITVAFFAMIEWWKIFIQKGEAVKL